MFPDAMLREAAAILDACRNKGIKFATAESCTGGLLSALFTEIPSSSDAFEGGFVTYSNTLKQKLLGVSADSLRQHGAVSAEVAQEMAAGAKRVANTEIAIAITGVAGPGASENKPAGLVYVAVAAGDEIRTQKLELKGTRSEVRLQTVAYTLELLKETLA